MITPFPHHFISLIPHAFPVCVCITTTVPTGDFISQVAWCFILVLICPSYSFLFLTTSMQHRIVTYAVKELVYVNTLLSVTWYVSRNM